MYFEGTDFWRNSELSQSCKSRYLLQGLSCHCCPTTKTICFVLHHFLYQNVEDASLGLRQLLHLQYTALQNL